jgi:hypothetical protein
MHSSGIRRRACGIGFALGLAVLGNAAAASPPPLPAALQVLRRLGCDVVPEASSAHLKELQCRDDRAYFLCRAMEKRDRRLDCVIGADVSRVDWTHEDLDAFVLTPAFVETLNTEPCAIWVDLDPRTDFLRYGRLCAAGILKTLGCESGTAGKHPACAAAAPACNALKAAAYVDAC